MSNGINHLISTEEHFKASFFSRQSNSKAIVMLVTLQLVLRIDHFRTGFLLPKSLVVSSRMAQHLLRRQLCKILWDRDGPLLRTPQQYTKLVRYGRPTKFGFPQMQPSHVLILTSGNLHSKLWNRCFQKRCDFVSADSKVVI